MKSYPWGWIVVLAFLVVACGVAERAWRIEYESRAESHPNELACRYYARQLDKLDDELATVTPGTERHRELVAEVELTEGRIAARCFSETAPSD